MRRFALVLSLVFGLLGVATPARACKVMSTAGPLSSEEAQRQCDAFAARIEHKTVEEIVAERERAHRRASAREAAAAIRDWIDRADQVAHGYGAGLVAVALATFAIRRRRRRAARA